MKNTQTSESVFIGLILAVSGGIMDVYSYLWRGKVFANAQTGNVLLFAINLANGHFDSAARYLRPIVAFVAGIALAEEVRYRRHERHLHWRQTATAAQIFILFAVAFMGPEMNLFANSLTSFACGIQVEAFRKISGNGIATTMCIGNLRSATFNLMEYIHKKDRQNLKRVALFYSAIGFFALGGVAGSFAIPFMGQKTILLCCGLLTVVFITMFIKTKENNLKGDIQP